MGSEYLRMVAFSYLLTGISQVFLGLLKNTGKAVSISVISTVSVLLNIGLNALLIFGLFFFPEMGIRGAALATVIARVIEVIWGLILLWKMGVQNWSKKKMTVDPALLKKDFWYYTLPVLGNEIVWGIGYTMYSVIFGRLGSDVTAANALAGNVKNLVACFCIGLGSGGGIMVGNLLGAFVWHAPIPIICLILNLDEVVKVPAVIHHFRKYQWVNNITRNQEQ